MVTTIKNSIVATVVATLAITSIGLATPVSAAQQVDINIPISTVIRGDEGSAHQLASEPVNPDYVGMVCDVKSVAENQHSIHPGNDIVVGSGTSSVVLEDVERDGGVLTTADGTLTLGNTITATLVLGADKVFSGGMTVQVTCEDQPEEIEVCRDGKIVTVPENKVRDTDTEPENCHPEEEKIKVCRGGEIITINASDKKSTDGDVEECKEEKQEPVVLPNTGAGTAIMGLFGITGLGATIRAYAASKKQLASSLLK